MDQGRPPLDEIEFSLKTPRKRRPRFDEDSRRKISEKTKGVRKSEAARANMRKRWLRMFITKHPLKDGEVYIRWVSRDGFRRCAIARDAEQILYSRDGVDWKVGKRRNPKRE